MISESKKDHQGRYRTLSLFKEFKQEGFKWFWTIEELKKIYLAYDHIPSYEYTFAYDHFVDWQHWEKVAEGGMKDTIIEWRKELNVKIKALGITYLVKQAQETGATGLQAAKYLADRGYESKRGRPSKAQITAETKRQVGDFKDLEKHGQRIGIH